MDSTPEQDMFKGAPNPLGIFAPVKASRNFTALWLGQTLSQFGDAVLWVTLPLAIFHQNASTLQLGLVMGLFMLPQIVLLPFTGILADRVSRIRTMMTTDIIRAVLVAILAVLYLSGGLRTVVLDVFVVIYGAADAVFNPAYAAARQQVFTSEIRNAAISLTQISMQTSRLLGPAIGGLIVGFASPAAGFGLDTVMLFASVISLTFLRLETPDKRDKTTAGGWTFYFHELLGGYHELRRHPWLWITILAFTFLSISSVGLTTILVPWLIKEHLHLPDWSYGLVNSAAGVGAVFAAVLYGRRSVWRHRAYLAYGGLALNALALFVMSFLHTTWSLMILMAIGSGGSMLFGVVWEGSMQELVAPEAYGRASSLDYFGSWVLLPIGNVLTGWLASSLGGRVTMWAEAAFMMMIVLVTMSVPAVRRFQ